MTNFSKSLYHRIKLLTDVPWTFRSTFRNSNLLPNKYFRDMKLILLYLGGVLSSCSQSICFKVMLNDSSWYYIFYLSARPLFKAKSSMKLWPVNAINIFHAIIIVAKAKAHHFKQALVKYGQEAFRMQQY